MKDKKKPMVLPKSHAVSNSGYSFPQQRDNNAMGRYDKCFKENAEKLKKQLKY
jgi:hypothetical protein